MGKLLFILAVSLSSGGAWAQAYCSKRLDHDSKYLVSVVSQVRASKAFDSIQRKYPDAVFCTSGVALEYTDIVIRDVFVIEIAVRKEGKQGTLEQFRILADGTNVSLLKFKESGAAIRRWAEAMSYRSAGVLPRIDATQIAFRLNVFGNSKAYESSLTAISFRFPATPSEVYSLVTWAAEIPGAPMTGERVEGAVIVQDEITGDIAVADQLNFTGLIEKLRGLVQK